MFKMVANISREQSILALTGADVSVDIIKLLAITLMMPSNLLMRWAQRVGNDQPCMIVAKSLKSKIIGCNSEGLQLFSHSCSYQ